MSGSPAPATPPQPTFTFSPAPSQNQNNTANGLPTAGILSGTDTDGQSNAAKANQNNQSYTGTVLGG